MTAGAEEPPDGPVARSIRWLFGNRRTGRITIAQWPNVALSVFIVAEVALRFVRSPNRAEPVLRVIAVAALVVWSADEILRGVNPFRRLLGAAVLLAMIADLALR
jgi:hypothetical protein